MATKTQLTRTQQALAAVEREGISVAEAARRYEITEAGIHRARREAKAAAAGKCPTCGGAVGADGSATKARRH